MSVEFDWLDSEKTIMCYTARPPWNWKDYYRAVKISAFKMNNLGHQVDVVLDLHGSPSLPAGAVGHLRGVGKPTQASLSGKAVILGCPGDVEEQITRGKMRMLQTGNQTIYFTDSLEEAIALLHQPSESQER